jgi:hypothetical protein
MNYVIHGYAELTKTWYLASQVTIGLRVLKKPQYPTKYYEVPWRPLPCTPCPYSKDTTVLQANRVRSTTPTSALICKIPGQLWESTRMGGPRRKTKKGKADEVRDVRLPLRTYHAFASTWS